MDNPPLNLYLDRKRRQISAQFFLEFAAVAIHSQGFMGYNVKEGAPRTTSSLSETAKRRGKTITPGLKQS